MVLLQSSILSLYSIVRIDTNSKLAAVKLQPPPYYKRNFVKGFYSDLTRYFAFVFLLLEIWGSRHTNRTRPSNHDCPQRGKIHTDLLLRGLQLVPCTLTSEFPRSQHRPSLISPPKLAHPKPSKPVKRWNFRKANWDHYSNLTNKLAKSIPPPESQNIDQVYQCFCKVISTAAKKCIPRGRRSNHIPCWDAECEDLYQHFLQFI